MWYGEKQQQDYIVKEGWPADLGRMVPLWTLVYCDWDNQVHKKATHLHKGRKMCLFIATTVLDKWDKVKQGISYHSPAPITLRYLIVPFWSAWLINVVQKNDASLASLATSILWLNSSWSVFKKDVHCLMWFGDLMNTFTGNRWLLFTTKNDLVALEVWNAVVGSFDCQLSTSFIFS